MRINGRKEKTLEDKSMEITKCGLPKRNWTDRTDKVMKSGTLPDRDLTEIKLWDIGIGRRRQPC